MIRHRMRIRTLLTTWNLEEWSRNLAVLGVLILTVNLFVGSKTLSITGWTPIILVMLFWILAIGFGVIRLVITTIGKMIRRYLGK